MTARLSLLVLTWIALLVLLAIAYFMAFLPIDRDLRPVILIPAVLMVVLVATVFMEAGRGPTIVRLFIGAGLLWLLILLGLGSLDPLTRTNYPLQTGVPARSGPAR